MELDVLTKLVGINNRLDGFYWCFSTIGLAMIVLLGIIWIRLGDILRTLGNE